MAKNGISMKEAAPEASEKLRTAVNARMREVWQLRADAVAEAATREPDVMIQEHDAWSSRRYVSRLLWGMHDSREVIELHTSEVFDLFVTGITGAAKHRVTQAVNGKPKQKRGRRR
jgi:hypothetical protein